MKWFLRAVVVASLIGGSSRSTRADDQDTKATLDKAIKALGGEEKLSKATTVSWKSKGTLTFNGNDNEISNRATLQGLDHYRSEFEGKFGDNDVKGVIVLNGDKGWRKFNENESAMDADAVANEKRTIYLNIIPITLVQLKANGFKTEAAGEEKIGDKPATVVKVTAADGKDFKLFFDKESGLPVKLVAQVVGFGGGDFTMETTYGDFKDFDGIKKATKLTSKRDGQTFMVSEITEFKVLDTVAPETFAQPK
jgi:hypothetical protein